MATIAVVPNQDAIFTALRAVLRGMLPDKTDVIQAQVNLVPEPKNENFVLMTETNRVRLATNVDDFADAFFVGSIAGAVMTITQAFYGALKVGSQVLGTGVAADTIVESFGTGSGGVGTYTVTVEQTLSSRGLAAGVGNYLQPTEVSIQLDVHGPASSDNAQTISTLMRDEYATSRFAALDPNIAPLHADDPRQLPFLNAEQQYEDRQVVEMKLQANQTVTVPQYFAAAIELGLVPVDLFYAVD